jgi:hypothetical protein
MANRLPNTSQAQEMLMSGLRDSEVIMLTEQQERDALVRIVELSPTVRTARWDARPGRLTRLIVTFVRPA